MQQRGPGTSQGRSDVAHSKDSMTDSTRTTLNYLGDSDARTFMGVPALAACARAAYADAAAAAARSQP